MQVPAEDMILVFRRKLAEIAAPTPNPDDQVAMVFRMSFGIQEGLQVQAVQLHLLAAQAGGANRLVGAVRANHTFVTSGPIVLLP